MKLLSTLFFSFFLLAISQSLNSQEYFPKNDGVKSDTHNPIAFTNAHIVVSPDKTVQSGTLIIEKGIIKSVGNNVPVPKNAVTFDLKGKYIYPSFIETYSDFGITVPKPESSTSSSSPQYDTKRSGFYWNEHIRPETNSLDHFKYDAKKSEDLRKAGFGLVNTHVQNGIIRGTGMLVALTDVNDNAKRILDHSSAQYFSFDKSNSKQIYPSSIMGAMALIRQVYYDAQWYGTGKSETTDLSLEAFNKNKGYRQIFYAGDKNKALRADDIGDQFNVQYTIVGGGDEYELIDQIKKSGAKYIIPIDFPKPFDVSNPFLASYVNLEDMRNWNQAPANPKILTENQIDFALTTNNIKDLKTFNANIQKAIDYGLDKKTALKALTVVPAEILGKSAELGTLEVGKMANFLIASGEIFDKNTTIFENWVQGTQHVIADKDVIDLSGKYHLNLNNVKYEMTISGKPDKPKVTVKKDTVKYPATASYTDNWLSIALNDDGDIVRLKTFVNEPSTPLTGTAVLANGDSSTFTATKFEGAEDKKDKSEKDTVHEIVPVTYPNVAYGFAEKPKQQTLLFKNATVWTNENEGILKNTDVLIKNGKIAKIGSDLSDRGATVIDATGKHLTSGIIDEHTHVAAMSSNEVGHNSTAEVTMEDAIDFEDINIYRNIAGGVTSMQILHGSANPIGGRSAIVKLKWGEIGKDMIYENSPKFIKFALGENVKQSRYPNNTGRFPQTRMGVEQVYIDYFQRAKEYDALKKSGQAYRHDIELETLAEILNNERFITCHSYVQSEINMLMKVAEQFDFNINTFTHILEGYKVADKMKAHGVGASTFSDWWAYKYEVLDAIPYNAAIMHKVGIVTAINSDDREMSRRLNQEAAKVVKYGGASEEEAWKMVTLNPAKLLHLDHRTGSIKAGKDADVVLWNTNPLSVYASAEKTVIDGKIYFDKDKLEARQDAIRQERNKLINMMLAEKEKGLKTQSPKKNVKPELHCDTIDQ